MSVRDSSDTLSTYTSNNGSRSTLNSTSIPKKSSLGELHTSFEETRGLMRDNVIKAEDRTETLNDDIMRTQNLRLTSTRFGKEAVKMKKKSVFKNKKVRLVLILLAVVLIFAVTVPLIICFHH
ncbi:unnamed protein product [Ambrosiozyma monospora]|uniref:Unnamed protein product n=1 Tax=Ambrosiozyma monospora TaxID=43982 RepID=A0ACB5TWT1_AMBMO|nr:unnamed protein product [Ambrosiozyma monospora]